MCEILWTRPLRAFQLEDWQALLFSNHSAKKSACRQGEDATGKGPDAKRHVECAAKRSDDGALACTYNTVDYRQREAKAVSALRSATASKFR